MASFVRSPDLIFNPFCPVGVIKFLAAKALGRLEGDAGALRGLLGAAALLGGQCGRAPRDVDLAAS